MKGIKNRKIGRIILFLSFGATIYFSYTFAVKFFRIESIDVVGQNIQVSIDQKKINANLLFFSTEKLKAQLLRENPLIATINITKKFPHTLVIAALARQAIVYYNVPARTIGIDRDGIVVGDVVPNSKLTHLLVPLPSLPAGSRITEQATVTTLVFLSHLPPELNIDLVEETDAQTLHAKIKNTDIFITQNSDGRALASSLQTLWEGFRIKGILPSKIDLRFEKPVVSF